MWGVEGDKTVGISDTIRVTADGCESFFSLDRDFVVKPAGGASRTSSAPELKSVAASKPAESPAESGGNAAS
jgi:Xaa-Pro dipeptidase